jgi:hypothetical protein
MNPEIKLNLALGEQHIVKDDPELKTALTYSTKTVTDLNSWLEVATYGLIEAEKPRIYADIHEHFSTALETYQKTGHSPELAEYKVLKDLGNARHANLKYSKVCFTNQDELNKANLQNRSWWTRPLFFLNIILYGYILMLVLFPAEGSSARIGTRGEGGLFPAILFSVFTLGLLYFEKEVKFFFQKRFSKHHILISQAFMVFLSIPFLQQIANDIRAFFTLFSPSNKLMFSLTTPISMLIIFLIFRWLFTQIPITIKTIRRLRA